jgi:erythromycin esterase-like protein
MGQYLKEDFGDRYVAIGTTFRAGGPDTTSTPDPQSIDAALAAAHNRSFGVVITGAPTHGAVAEFLDRPHLMRGENGYVTVVPREAFDALIFVDSVRMSDHVTHQ